MIITIINVVQNIRRGDNGHLAAKHVAMEAEEEFDLALQIVTMLHQKIYCTSVCVTSATVSCVLSFFLSLDTIIAMATNHVFFKSRQINRKTVFSGPPEYTSWGQWSSCSKTCSVGDRTRVRSCSAYCDNVKSSALLSSGTCNAGDCKLFPSIFCSSLHDYGDRDITRLFHKHIYLQRNGLFRSS